MLVSAACGGLLTPEDAKNILGQLFAGGTALAGLVLVFLGGVLTSYDSFDAVAKKSVRRKYRARAWLAFSGFLTALISAASGLVGLFFGSWPWLRIGLVALALSGILLVVIAVLSVREIS
jgi:divalent metal cation (Fe/Co/Zn/Cd) transporter